jgi:adenosine deaminase
VVALDAPHPIGPGIGSCGTAAYRAEPVVAAGLNCSVNSDDPPMFATDLNNEYLTLAAQGFTREQLWQLNLNGLEASFLAPAEKQALRAEWEAWRAGAGAGTPTRLEPA